MKSTQLSDSTTRFSEWYPFDKEGIANAPQQKGVYVIRKAKGQLVDYIRGKSDILYIGTTEEKKGLKGRLKRYFQPSAEDTALRVQQYATKHQTEIAWCVCDRPYNFETDLNQQFQKDHDQLPLLNRQGKKQRRDFTDRSLVVNVE
jgi:excinuclease UvrABC nuclease subunit